MLFYKSMNVSHSQYTFESMDECVYTLDIIRTNNVARVFLSTEDNGFALVVGKFDLGLSDDEILSIIKTLNIDDLSELYEELSEDFADVIEENYMTEEEPDYKESVNISFVN